MDCCTSPDEKSDEMEVGNGSDFKVHIFTSSYEMEAEEKGANSSIWVDEEGYVAEGPNLNVAFITHGKVLVLPFFYKILSGCTAKRLIELAPKLVEQEVLKGVRLAMLSVEEAKGAAEMMYVGSTLPLLPIIMWDEKPIGDGKMGELTMAL